MLWGATLGEALSVEAWGGGVAFVSNKGSICDFLVSEQRRV